MELYEEVCINHSNAELFVDALKKGEIELHPRYTLDKNGNLMFEEFSAVFVGNKNK